MGIFRGPGGTGDATVDASNEATLALAAAQAAELSKNDAANSAAQAATSASNASTSAGSASSSATSASNSASNALTSANNAANAEAGAISSASLAATSETNAANSASAASTSASNASNSESAASISESNAANSASAASTSASNAAISETNAANLYDDFDDRYLGAKASDPTLDNDGDALITGALYFNTVDDLMKVYDGATWLTAFASLSGALLATNNLSDLINTTTARTNLGVNDSTLTLATSGIATGTQTWTSNQGTNATFTVDVPATDLGITAGTTAGPILTSSTGNNATLPTATASASGVVTTGNQTWAGVKTFNSTITGSISGNAGTATTLQTARTINGTSFNGSSNITITAANPQALTIGTGLSGTSYDGGSAVTVAIDSTVATLTDTQTLTNKTISGVDNTLTNVSLTTAVTGTLPVDNGGTGLATLTANNLLAGNGTGTVNLIAPSTSGNIIRSNGTAFESVAPIASTAEAEAGTNNTQYLTPLRLREGVNATGTAPIYAARAWVNFDGTTATPSTIRGSANVSSVSRDATGVYTVNFTTAMPNANYSTVLGGKPTNNSNGQTGYKHSCLESTTSVTLTTVGGGGSNTNAENVTAAIFV
jgi:hypothetical protein